MTCMVNSYIDCGANNHKDNITNADKNAHACSAKNMYTCVSQTCHDITHIGTIMRQFLDLSSIVP